MAIQPIGHWSRQFLNEAELNHSMFPFVLKVIVRPAAGKTPIINNVTSQILFEGTVEKVEEHKTSCRKIGLSTAHRFMNGVDLDLQCLTLL